MIAALFLASAVAVVDGGTLRVNGEHIRLLGIEAPDIAARCRKGGNCPPADPRRSKDSLKHSLRDPITIIPVARDAAGRTVAIIYAGGLNVSCEQLRKGMAVYRPRWDSDRRLARECRFARAGGG
ncbi:nuclease (SNase domain-containing protein) [Sphingobium chlorophenolicum L-1]|uniref:Nuclease (SNase domain-containing protein) n=2 Tax=Sphingobium chlorophenolicum TaxID=46429 RepID=F6F2W8_SPHCR|nr:thermonuclease family protein [Sphingobium chlorophenolicum]AEG50780.1 nuclease (SNase domain-containing protein) [Sphingobium chlorophenolicum L-1]KEQ53960.1 Nuclease (SNase domain-containing protein) [Sphingobium chlorophenolicum]